MISESNKYQFYIGTSRGTLLTSQCDPKEKIKHTSREDASELTALTFGRSEDEIIAGYENGECQIYNSLTDKFVKSVTNLEGDGKVCGIGCINKTVIVGRHDGIINLWNGKKNDYFSIDLDEKGSMNVLCQNTNREGIVGTGGEFNDLKLWNVETKQAIFKAKSMGHDELNLPIPTSIRGICYFPENEWLTACATKEGHVLLYDDRAQRRPVVKFFEQKASFTCLSTAFRERQCLVGTTKGYMLLLDMKAGKCLNTFMSFSGSVTSIQCDPNEPVVASTSLDRHLRIHNMETKALLNKVYLKQSLTRLLMKPIVKEEPKEEELNAETNKEIDQEYEELFNNMETVSEEIEKVKKQKRKSVSTEESKKIKKKKKKVVKVDE
ncbi:unnamed protein product [Brassicogethes aeneus]|uniref:WD repeat-containing protein 74 n=1 Tax=Brassicogethes aeneus TaxID=1431903 RepID=A0A9P0FDB4_BRAAE|nr:unnamed protein product [Brassicogethes aeneus]